MENNHIATLLESILIEIRITNLLIRCGNKDSLFNGYECDLIEQSGAGRTWSEKNPPSYPESIYMGTSREKQL